MATLVNLPLEVLQMVLKELSPFDLDAAARTLNERLCSAARPLLELYRPWMLQARRMSDLFPREPDPRLFPAYPDYIEPLYLDWSCQIDEVPRKDYEPLGLNPNHGPYIRSSPPDLRSWMTLDGSLGWLVVPDEEVLMQNFFPVLNPDAPPIAPKWQIDIHLEQCREEGLTVPPGCETFLRSKTLHHRIPSASAWYFKLSKLIECPPKVDKGRKGYLFRFHCDQQFCAFAYLYLHPSGDHCVLISETDVYEGLDIDSQISRQETSESDENEDEDQAEGEGETSDNDDDGNDDDEESVESFQCSPDDFQLVALTFEEYLATVYYEGLLFYGAKPTQGIKDYVKHVFRSPAGMDHSRETRKCAVLLLPLVSK